MNEIQIGKFNITYSTENSLWIEKEDGEGGEFSIEKLERVIENFYNEEF